LIILLFDLKDVGSLFLRNVAEFYQTKRRNITKDKITAVTTSDLKISREFSLILGFHRGSTFIFVLSIEVYTVFIYAVPPMFRRYVLAPSFRVDPEEGDSIYMRNVGNMPTTTRYKDLR
jgi:hypothetical protein